MAAASGFSLSFPGKFKTDEEYVRAALATFLSISSYDPYCLFSELSTSEQCQVLCLARAIKREMEL